MVKRDYGVIFEADWINFIEDYLKKRNISFKKSEKNKIITIDFGEKRIIVGSRKNSPGTAVDIELMRRFYDVKKVFRLGSFGGYNSKIRVGDILLCTDAIRGEGTSRCYVPDLGFPAASDFHLTRMISPILFNKNKNYFAGTLWTTDGRIVGQYDKERITELLKLNVMGVDMDSSGFFVVSKVLGMQSVNLAVAVDLPLKDKEYHELPYKDEKVTKSLRLCSDVFMDYIIED